MEQSVRLNETNCFTRRNKLFCVLKQAVYFWEKESAVSVDTVFRICQAHACFFGVLFLLRHSEGKLYSHLL